MSGGPTFFCRIALFKEAAERASRSVRDVTAGFRSTIARGVPLAPGSHLERGKFHVESLGYAPT